MEFSANYGELAALATAFFWTATALSFEVASKRVGSLAVNMIRLVFAFCFLAIFSFFYRGMILPLDATPHAYLWLSISGLVGFVFGDYFLFRAFALISSRIAMLIMTLVPPITALIGWLLLKEILDLKELAGMFLTVGGISLAIITRKNAGGKLKFSYPLKGILFAVGGAIGQAVGLVLSKYGMQDYDPFAATHIRIIAGIIGFALIIIILGKSNVVNNAFKDKKGMIGITTGSFFGPFLGVSFSLLAIKFTATGIASTIMSIVPILLILPSIFLFKQRVSVMEIIGAFISVLGVTLFFL
ncbi:MAG: DMT family transporter [Bacteroidota bacterium]|nr:DMT family transporter [Bacteroidota bacterium]